jgi:hypothetical protein
MSRAGSGQDRVIVMPANVWGPEVRALDVQFPGLLGNLVSPEAWRGPLSDYYALDNGRFKPATWTEEGYLRHCDIAANRGIAPKWVAVPDVYGDMNATLREWEHWAPRLRSIYHWPLALVWQDGATVDAVNHYTDAEVQFIGGTTRAKWHLAPIAAATHRRVHVGRVNAPRPALRCWRLGVESIDGTGWRRTDRQRDGLRLLLETMKAGDKYLEPPLIDEAA